MIIKGELKDIVRTFNNRLVVSFTTEFNESVTDNLNALMNDKKTLKFDIDEWKNKRSLNANSYFHVLVNEIASVMKIGNDECKIKMNLEYGSVATDKNGNKVIIKVPSDVDISKFYDYAKFIAEKEEKGLKLSYYVFYKQTHTLNTKEMARLIDGTVEVAKELGIETKTPEELAKMKALWDIN